MDGQMERTVAILVDRIRIGPVLEQQPSHVDLQIIARIVECTQPVLVALIQTASMLYQQLHQAQVARLGGQAKSGNTIVAEAEITVEALREQTFGGTEVVELDGSLKLTVQCPRRGGHLGGAKRFAL